MASGRYSFIDIAVLDAVRARFAAGDALALLSVDLDEVLWANGEGAALFGHRDVESVMGADPALGFVARRQIAAVPGFPRMGRARAVMVRLARGATSRAVPFEVDAVTLPDGVPAVLLAHPGGADGDTAASIVAGFEEAGYFAALLDGEARPHAASQGFSGLGIAGDTLAGLVAEVAEESDRLVKRLVPARAGLIPAGIARLTDDPPLHLMIAVDEPIEEIAPPDETVPLDEAPAPSDADLPERVAEAAATPPTPTPRTPARPPVSPPSVSQGRGDSDDWYFEGTRAQAPAAGGDGAAGPRRARTLPNLAAGPVRFVWRTDARGAFSAMSGEFAEAVGSDAADIIGRPFREVAARFGLDADGEIARLLERRDTWSGRTVQWPVAGTDLVAPVDLAALPVYNRDRVFEGFRGFGVVRMGDAAADPQARGLALGEPPAAAEPAKPQPPAEPTDPFRREVPVISITERLNRRTSDKIIRLAEHRPPQPPERQLSPGERSAFEEIRERLRREAGAVEEDELPDAAADDAREEAPISETPAPEAPISEASVSEMPASETPVPEAPVSETPVPEAPVSKTPVPEAPASEASVSKTPVPEAPVSKTPVPEAPVSETPVPGASASETPASEASVSETPASEASVPEAPVSETPASETPVSETPVSEAPVSEAPVPEAPAPETPAPEAPAPEAPTSETSASEAPISETLASKAPALETPVSEAHAPETSAPEAGAPEEAQDEAVASPAPGADAMPPVLSGGERRPTVDPALVEGLPLPLLVHAGDELYFANREFLDLTGYASLDHIRREGGLDRLFVEAAPGEAAGGGRKLGLRTLAGTVVPVDAHLQSVGWGEGTALLLALRRADAPPPEVKPDNSAELRALESHLAELRTIIDTATDGVVLIAPDGTIRNISRPAEALFGFDGAEVEGKPFATLFAIESRKAARDYLAGLADNGVASVLNDGREVIGREREGRFIPLFMTIGRLPGDSGYCAVVRDITHFKRAEEELTQARAQAERASSQKTEFLARVSHEIRTPLNAIIGFSELMMDEKFGPIGSDRYRDYLRDINRSGNHVLDLVNDLLDISKIEAGEQEMNYEAVSLNEALAEAVAMMQPQANRERVIIRSSLASRLPEVVADLRSVRQIALNLLSNAIRYTQAGGQVIVSTAYETSGDVALRVRDTGIGMTLAEIDQALKPFKQINALKRGRHDGTGLGLPLTKAMVEANRARFAISSTPGEGTLVEIVFPSTRVLAE